MICVYIYISNILKVLIYGASSWIRQIPRNATPSPTHVRFGRFSNSTIANNGTPQIRSYIYIYRYNNLYIYNIVLNILNIICYISCYIYILYYHNYQNLRRHRGPAHKRWWYIGHKVKLSRSKFMLESISERCWLCIIYIYTHTHTHCIFMHIP